MQSIKKHEDFRVEIVFRDSKSWELPEWKNAWARASADRGEWFDLDPPVRDGDKTFLDIDGEFTKGEILHIEFGADGAMTQTIECVPSEARSDGL